MNYFLQELDQILTASSREIFPWNFQYWEKGKPLNKQTIMFFSKALSNQLEFITAELT